MDCAVVSLSLTTSRFDCLTFRSNKKKPIRQLIDINWKFYSSNGVVWVESVRVASHFSVNSLANSFRHFSSRNRNQLRSIQTHIPDKDKMVRWWFSQRRKKMKKKKKKVQIQITLSVAHSTSSPFSCMFRFYLLFDAIANGAHATHSRRYRTRPRFRSMNGTILCVRRHNFVCGIGAIGSGLKRCYGI